MKNLKKLLGRITAAVLVVALVTSGLSYGAKATELNPDSTILTANENDNQNTPDDELKDDKKKESEDAESVVPDDSKATEVSGESEDELDFDIENLPLLDDYIRENQGKFGYIPETNPQKVPISRENLGVDKASAYPSRYDGYNGGNGIMPAIRDQGSEGCCWAFANLGAAELDLIKGGVPRSDIDLSELALAYFTAHNSYDPKNCRNGDTISYRGSKSYMDNGGNSYMAFRAMALGIGPTEEKYAPYPRRGQTPMTPDASVAMGYNYAQLRECNIINIMDFEAVKKAISEHGGAAASFWAIPNTDVERVTDQYGNLYTVAYNRETNAFYGNVPSTNHEVVLVGWDDNFSRNNFYSGCRPDYDGAWLARNSWGDDSYDKDGYFWISYYDAGLSSNGDYVYVYDMDKGLYDNVYAYDGNVGSNWARGWGSDSLTMQQTFYVDGGEVINMIGVETMNPELQIGVTVTAGDQSTSAVYLAMYNGFHTVPLQYPITVNSRTAVKVEVSFFKGNPFDNDWLWVPMEQPVTIGQIGYNSVKESDFSVNGGSGVYDGRIKLYTKNAPREKVAIKRGYYFIDGGITAAMDVDLSTLSPTTIDNGKVVLTVGGNDREEVSLKKIRDDAYYWGTIKKKIRPRLYGQSVTVEIYDGNGRPVQITNSNDGSGMNYSFSLSDYIKASKANYSSDSTTYKKISATEEFMMAVRAYFGQDYNNEYHVSQELSQTIPSEAMACSKRYYGQENFPGLYHYGTSLILDGDVTLRHYFKKFNNWTLNSDTVKVTINGEEKVLKSAGNDLYYVEVRNIPASEFPIPTTVKLTNKSGIGSGDMVLEYSVFSYIYYAMVNQDVSQDTRDLAKALYRYWRGWSNRPL